MESVLSGRNQAANCGIRPNAMEVRTLGDHYRTAGLAIQPDPEGVRQLRTMEQTAGTVISIMTSHDRAAYSQSPHLPLPNPPVVRGIGIRWPGTSQGRTLSLGERILVSVGGIFTVTHIEYTTRSG